ncbi:kinase-like domain-containing protein [Mycena amicta]|nr:kinase-like domain-containing protein [Mycena amicta]
MEVVSGGTVADLTKSLRGLSEHEASVIIFQVLSGLSHIHSHNIIHREIKGQNILISLTGCVKIKDTGLSRLHAEAPTIMDLAANAPFLAPELVCARQYGTAVDIWSVGAVIIELLHGGHPWSVQDIDVLFKVMKSEWPKPTSMSPALEDLLTKRIFRKADRRSSAKDLLLHPWLQTVRDGIAGHENIAA